MCYFRSVPKSPVASYRYTGMLMRHPQRKQISHSINSSRVLLCRSLVLTQLVFVQMTIEGPSGRLTCIHKHGTRLSLETADGGDGGLTPDSQVQCTCVLYIGGEKRELSSVRLGLKTLRLLRKLFCVPVITAGVVDLRLQGFVTSPFLITIPECVNFAKLQSRQRGFRRQQVGFLEGSCSAVPGCLLHLFAARFSKTDKE